ncbi:MFS transporter [Lichenicola cladoniae]|uniref:MFS transporter n=1 Tax=Lichenicola cladoniae TaxID=1484109 RepID=A0A6M8HW83_9PROT|nr:MFS transporter [Acetobacteraceae bacterium]QKE92506.1 MFS transporter [Lichenicola cladoniae]
MTQASDHASGPGGEPGALRQLLPYWRVTLAAFLGWFLDAFDQVVLLLALPDIGKSLGASLTGMGLVITAQSIGRLIGNTSWGWLADRYGRKLTFMIGVIWFAVFSGVSGLAWSYTAMVVIQLLFGIGFGGEWTASASLLMESVPPKTRPMASAIMMSGYEFGFFAAAGAQALILPHYGWRVLFFIDIVPALLAIFIRIGVPESPVWLRMREKSRQAPTAAPRPKFRFGPAAIQALLFMLFLQFQNAAIYSFYPSFLRDVHGFTPAMVFPAVAAYCLGSIVGKPVCGWAATRFGGRITLVVYLVLTVLDIVPFLSGGSTGVLLAAACGMGFFGNSVFALVPHYLSQRFRSENRSFGMGISYAVASLGQGVASFVVPWGGGMIGLARSIELCVVGGSVLVALVAARQPAVLPGAHMEGDPEP